MAITFTYGSIDFNIMLESGAVSDWVRELVVSRTHIPYSNTDDVQITGLGGYKLTLKALLENADKLTTIAGYMDGTGRNFTDAAGTTFSGTVYLTAITGAQILSASGRVITTLQFERAG